MRLGVRYLSCISWMHSLSRAHIKMGRLACKPEIRATVQTRCKVRVSHGTRWSAAQNQRYLTQTKTAMHGLALPVADWPRGRWLKWQGKKGRGGQERNKCWYSSTAHPLWGLVEWDRPSTDCPDTPPTPHPPLAPENGNFHEGTAQRAELCGDCVWDRESWGSKHSWRLTLRLLFTTTENQPVGPRGKPPDKRLWLLLIQNSHRES